MLLLLSRCCPSIPQVPVELLLVRTHPAKSLSTITRTMLCLFCQGNSFRARGAHLQKRPNLFRRFIVMFVGAAASLRIALTDHFSSVRSFAA